MRLHARADATARPPGLQSSCRLISTGAGTTCSPTRQKKERTAMGAAERPPGPKRYRRTTRQTTRRRHAFTRHSSWASGRRLVRAGFVAGVHAAESIRAESRAERRDAGGLLSPPLLSAWRLGAAPPAGVRGSRLRLSRQHQRLRRRPRLRPLGILQRRAVIIR